MEANIEAENTIKLLVILTVYGYLDQYKRNQNVTILNPPSHTIEYPIFHTFWIGRRFPDDEELLYATKKSPFTLDRTNHKFDIDIQFEYFIAYVGVAVNVSICDSRTYLRN